MREADIQASIMLALSDAGCTIWRQNVGMGWTGRSNRTTHGRVIISDPRPLRAGLCVGSSDLIGIAPGGRFLAVEVKTPRGRVSDEQRTFIDAVNRAGGIGYLARSADEAVRELKLRIGDRNE